VKGTWWESSLAGDPEGEAEKALDMSISFHRGPAGESGRGLIYQGLSEMDEGGSRNGAFCSEETHCRGPLERAPLLGTLDDMSKKALDMGISLHRGRFTPKENREAGGGARKTGTLDDE
jgi:hypothetical protein